MRASIIILLRINGRAGTSFMSNFGLQQNTSVPLYRQLKDKILSDISSGKLAEGEKIPTEIELSELYNISRITVRNAVKELVAEGYLVKKQGKGTFVCLPKIERKVRNPSRAGAGRARRRGGPCSCGRTNT